MYKTTYATKNYLVQNVSSTEVGSQVKKSESWEEAFYKVDFVKIEDFCSMNDTVKKMKRHHRLVGGICKIYIWQNAWV